MKTTKIHTNYTLTIYQINQLKNKEAHKEAKLAKKIQEEELRSLFNESLTNQYGKKKSLQADKVEALGLNIVNQEVKDFLDGLYNFCVLL